MNYSALHNARAKVATARDAIAKDDEALQEIKNQVAVLEARIEKLKQRQEAKGLRAQLAQAEEALGQVEEGMLERLNTKLAGEIMRRMAADPVGDSAWIMKNLVKLRDSVRTEINTPITQRYAVHPLIKQALALLPPRDDTQLPVYDLGFTVKDLTDWPSRRRAIIAEAEAADTTPLEAA